jgi:starch synthase (maltosyl-transferring)
VRLVLAATLGPSYGIYSGFELIEHDAVPGTEEYQDSEKYQVKPRDWDAPGNIKATVTKLNGLRRAYRALQYNHDLWFLPTNDDQTVAYVKTAPEGGSPVLTVVNLDVYALHDAWFGLPLQALGLAPQDTFVVDEALTGQQFTWSGEWNHVQLDPASMPAAVFTLPGRPDLSAPRGDA